MKNEGFELGRVCVPKYKGLICGYLAGCGDERLHYRMLARGKLLVCLPSRQGVRGVRLAMPIWYGACPEDYVLGFVGYLLFRS